MTIVVLLLAPVFFGSVDLFWIAVWTILLWMSVLCANGQRGEPDIIRLAYFVRHLRARGNHSDRSPCS